MKWAPKPARGFRMDDFVAAQKAMVAQLPTTGVATIYARIGDLFAWLCVAGLLAAIALGLFPWG